MRIERLLVVRSQHVHQLRAGDDLRDALLQRSAVGKDEGAGHRSRGLGSMDEVDQPGEQRVHLVAAGLADLVAHAPEHDRRVVAITLEHGPELLRPPVLEAALAHVPLARVPLGVPLPLVERLVDDEEAHAIAQIQHLGSRRIVAAADGVAAQLLENRQATRQHRVRHCRADAAPIVVEADALHLDAPTVEQEALVLVEARLADAERSCVVVNSASPDPDRAPGGVESGVVDRPQPRSRDLECLRHLGRARGVGATRDALRHDDPALAVADRALELESPARRARLDARAQGDLRRGGRDYRRRHPRAPVRDVDVSRPRQPDVAVDPGAAVVAAVRLIRVVDAHGQ